MDRYLVCVNGDRKVERYFSTSDVSHGPYEVIDALALAEPDRDGE